MNTQARSAAITDALAAAGIPLGRVGRSRTAGLRDQERSLYHWILRRFAAADPPDPAALAYESRSRGLPVDDVLATFAREDLVHADESERIAVAYPFSGPPTPHRVRYDGREVHAMCAIDALGIAPMLGVPIEVVSSDPVDGRAVHVSLAPDGRATWRPEQAVVVAGSACEGDAFRACCQVLNFFASTANAERYLRERASVRGFPISLPQAIELGRIIFGDVLADA